MSATVLIVEDDEGLREALVDTLELAGMAVLTAGDGQAALEVVAREPVALVVSDVQMARMDGLAMLRKLKAACPELPVLLMTAYGSVQQAVSAMRDGAADYLLKPFEAEVLVTKVSSYLQSAAVADDGVVAADPASRELINLARRVSASDVSVMVSGESGTGKEVLARFVHAHSARAGRPFVAINCAAIPDNMLEAILFGYEKGAFTGAYKACPGKFEQANGGTLLLDEITEMDLGLQAKLLRVLQEREVERLGGRETLPLDLRVIATSNRDLPATVAAGAFREDLYYRLNVFPLHLPPLRERPGDVVPLAEHLAARAARNAGRPAPRFSESAASALRAYAWPGNVRELDNVVQRALVLQPGTVIERADLHLDGAARVLRAAPARGAPAEPAPGGERLDEELRSQEHRLILEALNAESGSRKAAAEKLGISPRTLRYKLARMREAGLAIPGHGA